MGKSIYRALVVDDEPLIREATARALVRKRFCCDTASDGQEAYQLYREQRHDLVVTDLRMPNVHGHTLATKLLKEDDPPKVVVLTGVSHKALAHDLANRGVMEIITKPVDFIDFASKMLAVFEPNNWSSVRDTGKVNLDCSTQHDIVSKIESSLEIFSMCIPPELDAHLLSDHGDLSNPPATIMQYLERLILKKNNSSTRRNAERIPLLTTVVAIPVNKDFVVKGNPLKMTFSNFSETGACLFHTRTIDTQYLALRWRSLINPMQYLKAVMKVVRCEPIGPFYEIGGEFVMHD